jgi:hypothetical protein
MAFIGLSVSPKNGAEKIGPSFAVEGASENDVFTLTSTFHIKVRTAGWRWGWFLV